MIGIIIFEVKNYYSMSYSIPVSNLKGTDKGNWYLYGLYLTPLD